MNKPKYRIGDRLKYEGKYIGLTVRGIATTSYGHRYFIQVDNSNNCFTIDSCEMAIMLERCSMNPTDY